VGKFSRIDLYLHDNVKKYYNNTDAENELVAKFSALYSMAKSAQDKDQFANPKLIEKSRKAYLGTLKALNRDGEESKREGRQLRKMIFELVESKVDNSIPMPKMQARYKTDLPVIDITEHYLKFEMDRILTKYINDKSERSTYVDGTGWYKVCWDSMNSTHKRSGDVMLDFFTIDQITPQPGVDNYKELEYIFERKEVSMSRIWDLYGRLIKPSNETNNMVEIISCYYLNENHIVGLFIWAPSTMQVICNEEDWQIRKLRRCKNCDTINPIATECKLCGHTKFEYSNAMEEILDEDLQEIYNPYDVGETNDPKKKDEYKSRLFASKGTEIPFYHVRQLPFVPRPAVSAMDSIYGISEAFINIEGQDMYNKVMTKAVDKTLKSGAVVTKPQKMKIGDDDETFKIFGVKSAEEAQQVQAKQIVADTSQDILIAQLMYNDSKSASGVTDSFQGKQDSTATSGKAKQYAAAMSAGRIESLRVMKSAAFAGVYELIFKYLLAFSDEQRKFVRILPDGSKEEQCWNKYMFLDKDDAGQYYYRDDFIFGTDAASTLSQNRVQMWQETQDKFIQGALGNPADPRTMKLFWHMMEEFQYPLAKTAVAGIEDMEQHLPPELEQMIMQNPQILQVIQGLISQGADGRGGARPNSGPDGNGATHSANVERTNERNRAQNRDSIVSAQQQVRSDT
jgi:hypothetical protein